MPTEDQIVKNNRLYKIAFVLAGFAIGYNLVEGVVSIFLGCNDESLALFGFGVDSFIEVISGLGVLHMVIRIKQNPDSDRDRYEKTALRITGVSFYLLMVGLVLTAAYNLFTHHQPKTTLWGLIISSISIIVMFILISAKTSIGEQLKSDAILADVHCTMACVYMSITLLMSSAMYYLFNLPYIDSFGALGLAFFAFIEGKECFLKANKELNM